MLSQQDKRDYMSKVGVVLWAYIVMPMMVLALGLDYAKHGISWAMIAPVLLIVCAGYRVFRWYHL